MLVVPCWRASVVVPARAPAKRFKVQYRFVLPCWRASVVVPAKSWAKRRVE